MRERFVALILSSLHCAIFIALATRDWTNWAGRAFTQQLACVAHLLGVNFGKATNEQQCRGKQPKPPRVLAVVLADGGGGDIAVRKLSDVLTWCLQRGIQTLFVYRSRGLPAAQWRELTALVGAQTGRNIDAQVGFGKSPGSSSRKPSDSSAAGASGPPQSGGEQDTSAADSARLILLDVDEARWPLLEAARNPGPCMNAHGLTQAQRGTEYGCAPGLNPAAELYRQLARVAGSAITLEPDIVLVCGKAFTLAGFPPWLLRFSELYHLGALEAVTLRQLAHTLRKYSNVTQRFGA